MILMPHSALTDNSIHEFFGSKIRAEIHFCQIDIQYGVIVENRIGDMPKTIATRMANLCSRKKYAVMPANPLKITGKLDAKTNSPILPSSIIVADIFQFAA